MYYSAEINFKFRSAEEAEMAKDIAINGLNNEEYSALVRMVNDMEVKGSELVIDNDTLFYYFPEGMAEPQKKLLEVIANEMNDSDFEFYSFTDSDTSSIEIIAEYKNGVLVGKSELLPCGFLENLYCEECGEDLIAMDDFDPTKTYICPTCGEVVDLLEQYNMYKPIVKEFKEIIK